MSWRTTLHIYLENLGAPTIESSLLTFFSYDVQHLVFYKIMDGHDKRSHVESPLPHTYIKSSELPDAFDWGNVDGVSYLTHSLNQHLPQCTFFKMFVCFYLSFLTFRH